MPTELSFDDEIQLRDLMNGVRKSRLKDHEHENRYYNFKEKIICTLCYERSLFEPPIRKVLAKYYRIDKTKDTNEEEHMFLCGDCSDLFDGDDEKVFVNMWDIEIIDDDE